MKKIICIGMVSLIMTGMTVSKAFTDVPTGHWAEAAINKMVEQKIISGNTDGTFRPADNLKKIQSIILLAKAAGVEKYSNSVEEYVKKYDKILTEYKVGESNKKFIAYLLGLDVLKESELENYISLKNINLGITREEMAILVTRTLGKEQEAQNQTLISVQFDDISDISSEAKPCVQYLYNERIMTGVTEKTFCPKDYVTRAQAAVILNNIVDKINIKSDVDKGIADNTKANITLTNGKITDVDTSLLTIEIDEEDIYEYDDNTKIYVAGKTAKIDEVELDMKVTKALIVDGVFETLELNGEVIESTNNTTEGNIENEEIITGEIVEIVTNTSKSIVLKVDKKEKTYNVVASTKFYQAGEQVTIYDFNKSDEVTLKVENDEIKEMYYASEIETDDEKTTYKVGTVVSATTKKLTIKLLDGKQETIYKNSIGKIIDEEELKEIKLNEIEKDKNIVAVGAYDGDKYYASVIVVY